MLPLAPYVVLLTVSVAMALLLAIGSAACFGPWTKVWAACRCLLGAGTSKRRVLPEGAHVLTLEELEAACAGSGFSREEVLRLQEHFTAIGGGAPKVQAADLVAGLPQLAGPLLPRLPSALRLPAKGRPVDFRGAVSALSVFCERTPADDKARLLFQLYDSDGDGSISRADLRCFLDLVLPEARGDEEFGRLLDRAVEGTFEELAGRGAAEGLGLEQFMLVAGDLAAERGTAFF